MKKAIVWAGIGMFLCAASLAVLGVDVPVWRGVLGVSMMAGAFDALEGMLSHLNKRE